MTKRASPVFNCSIAVLYFEELRLQTKVTFSERYTKSRLAFTDFYFACACFLDVFGCASVLLMPPFLNRCNLNNLVYKY